MASAGHLHHRSPGDWHVAPCCNGCLSLPLQTLSTQRPAGQRAPCLQLPTVLSQWPVLPEGQGREGLGLCPPLLYCGAMGRGHLPLQKVTDPSRQFFPPSPLCPGAGSCWLSCPSSPGVKVPSCGQGRVPPHLSLLSCPLPALCKKSLCYTTQMTQLAGHLFPSRTLSNVCAL